MKRALVRKPQSGAVLNLLAVSCGPTWTIPSPVPMSCNKKVAKGMDYFVSQSFWNRKHATIDHRPDRSRGNGFHMADVATDLAEKLLPVQGCGGRGKRCVARWNHRAAYELSKVVDVRQAEFIWLIVEARRGHEEPS